MFTSLTKKIEIEKAHRIFRDNLLNDATDLRIQNSETGSTTEWGWRDDEKLWIRIAPRDHENHYWFNTKQISGNTSSVTLEINTPANREDKTFQGAFVRGSDDITYIAHTGRVRRNNQWLDISEHMKRTNAHEVSISDGSKRKMIVISAIDSADLLRNMSNYVREVEKFKELLAKKSPIPKLKHTDFSPEFQGTKSYDARSAIEAECGHGEIVNSLFEKLDRFGLKLGNDRYKDLVILDEKGNVATLFEVKTACDSTNIYQAIGQLKFHSTGLDPVPRTIAVLPSMPNLETQKRLSDLKIEIVTFNRTEQSIAFPKLREVIDSL